MITKTLNIAFQLNRQIFLQVEEKLKATIGHLSKKEIKKRMLVKHFPAFKKEYYLDGKFLFLSDAKYNAQDKVIDIIISEKQ